MRLKQLQQDFLAALNYPDKKHKQLLSVINSSVSLSSEQRLAIYRNSMIENFIKALTATYPVTLQLVGEDFFRFMAKRYIAETPSNNINMGDYGATLPQFIANFKAAESIAYLADIAQLEWYYDRVYYGPSSSSFDFQALAAVPAELQSEIIFQLPKNSFLLESKFPISRIWQIHQSDYTGEFTVDFNNDSDKLVIYKIENIIKIYSLSLTEWLLLNKCKESKKLAELENNEISLIPTIIGHNLIVNFITNL